MALKRGIEKFDRGYLSPYFVTDADRMEDPYILIYEKKISNRKNLLPVRYKNWKEPISIGQKPCPNAPRADLGCRQHRVLMARRRPRPARRNFRPGIVRRGSRKRSPQL